MNMPIQPPPVPRARDVWIDKIQPDPRQERRHFDEAALQELAESIRRQGVINPISLQPAPAGAAAEFQIIAGERRWRAARIAGLELIPASVYPAGLSRLDVVMIQSAENEERVDTPLLDRAARISTLVAEIGAAAVASARGKSEAWVSKLVNVHRLPPLVKEIIQSGKLDSVDTAFELAKMVKLSEDHELTQACLVEARAGELVRSKLRHRLELLDRLVRPALPIEPPAPEVKPEEAAPPAAEGEGAPAEEPPAPVQQAGEDERDSLHDFEASMRSAAASEPRDDSAAEVALSQLTEAPAAQTQPEKTAQDEAAEPQASAEAPAIEAATPPAQAQPEPVAPPAAIVVAPGALAALAQLLAGGEKVTATLSLGSEPGQLQCVVVTTLGAEPANLSAEGKAARMRLAVPIAWKAPADSIDADFISYLTGKSVARAGDVQAYQAAQQKKPTPPPAPKPAASKPVAKPAKKKPAAKPVKSAKPAKAQKPAAKPTPAKSIAAAPSTPPGMFDQTNPST